MFGAIATVDTFSLPPDPGGSVEAFARMGYDLETALADIIDNAIDARAEQVEVTFFRDDLSITAVSIADDGTGMSAAQLRAGMRFAGKNEHAASDLGTFGLGLKSASFSQCRTLTVISRSAGAITACRWKPEDIEQGWLCAELDSGTAGDWFKSGFSVRKPPRVNGTMILWERLDRLEPAGDLDSFLSELLERLELSLGITFHRFLARNKLKISIGTRHVDEPSGFPRAVRPHDPFGYPRSGRTGYPKTFKATLPGVCEIKLEAHIWPAKSTQAEFKLGRRSGTSHQGLYFYRNDRLIQAGGWNGVVKDVSDSELSLARIAVDLPPQAVRIVTVEKSKLQVTAALSQALEQAKAGKTTLTDYLTDARRTYRAGRRQTSHGVKVPVVPGPGLPVAPRRAIAQRLAGAGLSREITFEWVTLKRRQVFAVDADEERILINKKYRPQIAGSGRASPVDAPLVKLLLFLLLQGEFERERVSAKTRAWIDKCNAILLEALKSK